MKKETVNKIHNLGQSLNADPFTFKKALILCLYAEGIRFAAGLIIYLLNMSVGLVPDILYLGVVLLIVRETGKDQLRRIFTRRKIAGPVLAGLLIMFFGMEIIKSELHNVFVILIPVPEGFFDGFFYQPRNAFLLFLSMAVFPGFSEEVFFRGIIAHRFFRTYSARKAILLSAALFGIMHINPWQATNAFLGGIFYGWVYWRYRSIWLTMAAHATHNTLVTFFDLPYVVTKTYDYTEMWHHPVWFVILGVLLFGFGLLTVIVLDPQRLTEDGKNDKQF